MPENTNIIITNVAALVEGDVANSIDSLDKAIETAVLWNNAVVEAGNPSTREFARVLAEQYNAIPNAKRPKYMRGVVISDTKYNSKVQRAIKIADICRTMPERTRVAKGDAYVAQCAAQGREIKLSGLYTALTDTGTKKAPAAFDATKLATRVTKGMTDAQLDALIAALSTVKLQRKVTPITKAA